MIKFHSAMPQNSREPYRDMHNGATARKCRTNTTLELHFLLSLRNDTLKPQGLVSPKKANTEEGYGNAAIFFF